MVMNELLKNIALQVGGSHYPDVSKPYFEQTVQIVLEECISVLEHRAENWRTDSAALEARRCITAIQEHFGVK
jgi:hypothetical protein